jgi:hypothetical protein
VEGKSAHPVEGRGEDGEWDAPLEGLAGMRASEVREEELADGELLVIGGCELDGWLLEREAGKWRCSVVL